MTRLPYEPDAADRLIEKIGKPIIDPIYEGMQYFVVITMIVILSPILLPFWIIGQIARLVRR